MGVLDAPQRQRLAPLVIFTGESNAGGVAENIDLSASDLLPRPAVQIWNNLTGGFEDLRIGVNNLLGHTGLVNGTTHGWEHGLAKTVEAGEWFDSRVHLVKTAQGGSDIGQWSAGNASGYWTTAVSRVSSAIAALRALGKIPLPVIWYSQGINDRILGTDPTTWKAATLELFSRWRAVTGTATPILTTQLLQADASYNAKMKEIADADPFVFYVYTFGPRMRDTNHWASPSMRLMAEAMVDMVTQRVGQHELYLMSQANVGAGATDVTWGLPAYQLVPCTWTSISGGGAGQQDGLLTSGGTANTGALGGAIESSSPWEVVIDFGTLPASSGVVVYVDSDNGANFAWHSSNPFLSGIFHLSGDTSVTQGGGAATATGVTVASNTKVKMRKAGNDVVYSRSTDGGLTYIDFYTHTGRLTGVTGSIFVKALFAFAGTFSARVAINTAT